MTRINKRLVECRCTVRQKPFGNRVVIDFSFNKIKNSFCNITTQGKLLIFENETIVVAFIAFMSITLSTVMRMGYGIFEYSFISLLLNGLIYSLVTGAIFIKNRINCINAGLISKDQIKRLIANVAVINLISYPLVMLADRQKCLSSSIMFINFFVFTVLLLIFLILPRRHSV